MAGSKITRQSNIELTTLWTNPDTTQTFAAQTISIDVSNYDILIMWFYRSTSGLALSPFLVNVNAAISSGQSQCKTDIVDLTGHFGRRVFKITGNSIIFENGNKYNSYAGGTVEDNTVLVPTLICGLKVG